MKAFLFPGQGSQKEHMGKDLYENFPKARTIFEQANDILGERFSDFLFSINEEELMDTRFTQMGIFIYEVAAALGQDDVKPDCVAGHSLGEYAALVVSGALSFEEGGQCRETLRHPWRGQGNRLGLPDSLLRIAALHNGQGPPHQCRECQYRRGFGR